MSDLLPHETILEGGLILSDGKIVPDEACERIEWLTTNCLEVIQDDPNGGGWVRLFRDRRDGRYWERTYPKSEMHGGGPPMLNWVSDDEVAARYQAD